MSYILLANNLLSEEDCQVLQKEPFRNTFALKYNIKSRIRETPNLSTDADSSTNILVSAGIKKGADSIFVLAKKNNFYY